MTELDLLRDMFDAAPAQREQARAVARTRLAAAASAAQTRHPPARTRTLTRVTVAGSLTAVVTTALAVALAAGGLTTGGHEPLGQPASAAELLRHAAAAPAPPVPRPGQFIYIKSAGLELIYPPPAAGSGPPGHLARQPFRDGKLVRFTQETWTSVNGTRDGLVREWPCEPPNPVSSRGCEYTVGWGVSPGQAKPTPNPPGTYGWETALPTSRSGLTRYLETLKAEPGTPAQERIWDGIYGLFQDSALLPPRLRTAAFELAASLPRVRLIPHVADAAGRIGDAIALDDSDGFREELIIQPATYQLLGEQLIIITPAAAQCASQNPPAGKCHGTLPLPAGAVSNSEAYLQVSVTNSAPASPSNGEAPLGERP